MSIFEIISAIVLIVACVFIVVVILMKDTKTQMSQTISGTSSDSFYQKNAGRTKEAILNKTTIAAMVIFFVLAIAVNIINVNSKKTSDTTSKPAVVTSEASSSDSGDSASSDTSEAASDTSAADSNASAAESAADSAAGTAESTADSAVSE